MATDRPLPSRADRITRAVLIAAALLFVLGTGAFLLLQPRLERWIANDVAEIGGPFELVSHTGEPFTEDDLLGRPHVLYFGFTYCPDICPTMLLQLGTIVSGLGAEAEALQVAMVSVDPERDTLDILSQYVPFFHEDFVGLTGSPEAVAAIAQSYRIYYRKIPFEDGDYTIEHTASALLFNADGTYADAIAHDESDASAREKIVRLIADNN